MHKHILDIGRPKRKEGSRSSGAGDRRSSVDKPPSRPEQSDGTSKPEGTVVDDETSQESQSVSLSSAAAPATGMSESPTGDQTPDSMVWHPSDNLSANANSESPAELRSVVVKEVSEVK